MVDYNNLDELIEDMEAKCRSKDLSDAYLSHCGASTREDIGIGEYAYGIVMVPADWVLSYLKELAKLKKRDNNGNIK